MGLFKVDTWFAVALSGILVLLYGATLIKVCRGSKYKFVITLLVLLLLSNLSIFPYMGSFYELITKSFSNVPWFWITLDSFCGFTLLACFNAAHWIFAFEYYSIARFMPFVLKGQDLPESKVKCDRVLNKVMLLLNIALPFLIYMIVFYGNWLGGN
jgi:hypothetical protein